MNFFVIPGRGVAASPEPMNTAAAGFARSLALRFPESVFMGSGPSAPRCPGMTVR